MRNLRESKFFVSIIFALATMTTVCRAQEKIDKKFEFIHYELNRIIIPGDSIAFQGFINKLKSLSYTKASQVNIVHIGGSHVQADMWTGRIREDFNRLLNQTESARGMMFPYKAVKTNGSLQFDVVFNKIWEGYRNVKLLMPDEMGLMGWTATARDSGQFMDVTLKGDTVSSFYFDKLRIFHNADEESFDFDVKINDSIYQPVFIDSCKCSEITPVSKSKQFVLTVHKTDSLQKQFVLHGIQTILNQPGLTYHSVGVNGASVKSYLNCNLLADQIQYLNPDLIIFSIGINDSFDKDFTRDGFEAGYNELISRIKVTCPDAAILFITNTDSYKKVKRSFYKNLKGREVQLAMTALAKQHHAAVWDLYAVMGGLGSISKWKKHGLAQKDLIHLTRNGYFIIGDLLFDAIINFEEVNHQNP